MEPATPTPVSRPRSVSIASYLLCASAAVPVMFALVQVVLVDDMKRAAELPYAGTSLAATAGTDAATTAGTTLVSAIVSAIAIVAIAYFCARGKNPARILVWIFAGGSLLTLPISISVLLSPGFFDRKPSWYLPLYVADITIIKGALFAASVLLALPASRPFFRKPQASATPAPEATDQNA